ncbi:MAG: crotonase/enoyl-CoA hydratase family protein [Gammaproteobacteria bacterium]|nr:crotonase/enoyl-CoA hydratase family protein [Gammaproteobacteria bacterium]
MNSQTAATAKLTDLRNSKRYTSLKTHYDAKHEVAWCYMHAQPRPSFTPALLEDLNAWCDQLAAGQACNGQSIAYHVLASDVPGVYNLGGDLALFRQLVEDGDREGLLHYARRCIDAMHANIRHFDRDITTISLVQGDALGGGFETAMSSDVLIAEKGSKLGLPEVLFNLFPGMGAYSLLSRKLTPAQAERLILSGRIFTAEELYDMGVVDVLAEAGEGEMAVYEYIKRENRARNGFRALRKVRAHVDPVTYQELADITEIWVDAALELNGRDLRMMERLVSRQSQKADTEAA